MDKDHPIKGKWVIGDYQFDRCPMYYLDNSYYEYIKAYNLFKNGILPRSGGYLDQTYKFSEVMTWIDNKMAEHQSQRR